MEHYGDCGDDIFSGGFSKTVQQADGGGVICVVCERSIVSR